MIEIKSIPCEVKDIDTTGRRVVKYVSAFGSVDSHNDIMQKGAYAKTIRESKQRIKFLWNHNSQDMPVGVLESIEEDEFGLKTISKLLPTTKGNDLLICYENGAINEHSVGFFTINKKSNATGQRVITETQLIEYSAVLWGSNENTPLLGMKSANPIEQLAELQKRCDRIYKTMYARSITDETAELLAIEIAMITKSMTDLVASLQPKEPELASTPAITTEPTPDYADILAAFRQSLKL
jgi:HK97 family phage prohead protease